MDTDSARLCERWSLPAGRRFFYCTELAEIFGVSGDHMRRLCEIGEIKAEPIPGRNSGSVGYWRIPVLALIGFLKRRSTRAMLNGPAKRKKRRCKEPAKGL